MGREFCVERRVSPWLLIRLQQTYWLGSECIRLNMLPPLTLKVTALNASLNFHGWLREAMRKAAHCWRGGGGARGPARPGRSPSAVRGREPRSRGRVRAPRVSSGHPRPECPTDRPPCAPGKPLEPPWYRLSPAVSERGVAGGAGGSPAAPLRSLTGAAPEAMTGWGQPRQPPPRPSPSPCPAAQRRWDPQPWERRRRRRRPTPHQRRSSAAHLPFPLPLASAPRWRGRRGQAAREGGSPSMDEPCVS